MSQDGYRMIFDSDIAKHCCKLKSSDVWLFIDGMGWLNAHYLETPTIDLDIDKLIFKEINDIVDVDSVREK